MLSRRNKGSVCAAPSRPSRAQVFLCAGALLLSLVVAGCGSDQNTKELYPDVAKNRRPAIEVDLKASRLGGPAPVTTKLHAEALHTHGDFIYTWHFDDGTTSREQNPTHTFTEPGYYTVLVDVRDSEVNTGATGAYIPVWPPGWWNASPSRNDRQLQALPRRKKWMTRRTVKRYAALVAKVRAQQKRQAGSL